MSYSCQLMFRSIVIASLLIVAPPAMRNAFAQGSAMPSQIEREFWTSTRQIDTVAAYQAYLDTFPKGFFAPLAFAAIKKGDSTTSATSPRNINPTEERRDSTSKAEPAQFLASKIAGPTNSSAITQQVGDVFHGPGPITVGWLGAKKQIVVPGGEWVLLAAEDSLSNHKHSMSITALVLARLEGSTVRSFLVARFNSKVGNSKNTWSDAAACGSERPSTLFAWTEQAYWVTQCVRSALIPQANAVTTFSGTIWKEALRNLAAGGGALPSSSYLLTEMFYTGDFSNYLKVSRIDFGVSLEESTLNAPAASIDLSPLGREKWAKAYSALAALGYRKKLAEDELDAGGSATITSVLLTD